MGSTVLHKTQLYSLFRLQVRARILYLPLILRAVCKDTTFNVQVNFVPLSP